MSSTKRKYDTSSEDEPPVKSKARTTKAAEKGGRKKKDSDAPKKAGTSYMLWLKEVRPSITKPGMGVTDVAKKAGQLWKGLKDKSKWEKMAEVEKQRYKKEMDEYKKKGGGGASSSKSPTKKAPAKKAVKASSASDESDTD